MQLLCTFNCAGTPVEGDIIKPERYEVPDVGHARNDIDARMDFLINEINQWPMVHVISTPFGGDDPAKSEGANKANEVANKESRTFGSSRVFVFNPNNELQKLAQEAGMTREDQNGRWLEMWMRVMRLAHEKGGNLYVMTHRRRGVLGGAQKGEIQAAEAAGFSEQNVENGRIVYVEYDECYLLGTLYVKAEAARGLGDVDPCFEVYTGGYNAEKVIARTPHLYGQPDPVWTEGNGFQLKMSKEQQNLWFAIKDERTQQIVASTHKHIAVVLVYDLGLQGGNSDWVQHDYNLGDDKWLRVSFSWRDE